jgi:Purple acid Phosphatase, N-terminal domain
VLMNCVRQPVSRSKVFRVAVLIGLWAVMSACGAGGAGGGGYTGGTRGTTGPDTTSVTGAAVSNVTETGAVITWQTNNPSSSQVSYGTAPTYGNSTAIADTTGTMSHTVNLGGLIAGTTYHFQAVSVDATGAKASSSDQTFTTSPLASVAPKIATPTVSGITGTQAAINWTTDIASDSQVEYGTTTAYGTFSAAVASQVTSHSITVTGLSAGTTYHYRVHSGPSVSADFTFVTSTAALAISNVTSVNITANAATIGWVTNSPANTQVDYGTTTAYGLTTTLDPTLVTTHAVNLTGLTTNTTYHFRVHSGTAVSGDFTFVTTSLQITSVSAGNVKVGSALIVWATNAAANSQVEFGTSTAYGSSTTLDSTLTTSHSVSLTGLAASTVYHFRVKSGAAVSSDFTFATQSGAISLVLASQVTSSSALITWTTGLPGTSQVDFGTSTAYGSSSTLNANLVLVHAVALTGLSPSTTYHFRVHSGTFVSTDFVFATLGTVPVDSLTLPSGFIGWQRLGSASYAWSPTFGGTPSATACSGGSCAFMNSSLRFSPPDPVTQSPNQCLPDGWNNNGATVLSPGQVGFYSFGTACPAAMNAQSSGIFDPVHNRYCIMGGGHSDYYGTDIWCLDLSASPFSWKRVKDSAFPVDLNGPLGNTLQTAIKALGGQTPGTAFAECLANSTTGFGCTPDSRHTTQGMQYLPGRTATGTIDNTLDTWFLSNGGLVPNGNSAKDTWTLGIGNGISNASQWRANYQMSNFTLGAGVGQPEQFGNTSAVDPRNSTVFMTDPGGGGGATRALWMFDNFGTVGAPNKWYRATAVDAFKNSTDGSAAIWHNAADNHSWFVYVGGCRQDPITSISRSGGTVTATINALVPSVWFASQRIYLGQVSDSSFNVGDGNNTYSTTATVTASGSSVTMTFPTGDLTSASSSGGFVYSCQRSSGPSYVNVNGVNVADITDTAATISGTVIPAFWTDNTMDPNNLDVGGLGYNSCAEFLTGGSNPLKTTSTGYGSQSPGFVVDGFTGTIVGWPNEGPYVYEITPDPVNSRLACRRISFSTPSSENPPNASVNGANSTWGTYGNGKMSYIPDADAFLLCHAPNLPCEIMRLRSANVVAGPVVTGVSSINITNSGATVVWSTNVAANSQVEYGTSAVYGSMTTLDSTQVTSHSVVLSGLSAGTTYHFRVHSGSSASGDFTFTTSGTGAAPAISAVSATGVVSNAATITWSTDIAANSQVEYGTTTAYGTSSTLDGALVTSHSEPLTGLSASTTYHFRVHSGTAVSADNTFTTPSGTITPPPAGDTAVVYETSGSTQTNRPVSIARAFVQGEIAGFAQPAINGTTITDPTKWQCDVKNRWPDGSLKFAIVSFVIPTLPASGSVNVTFVNNASGNNTGEQTVSQMLGAPYDFDVDMTLTGTATRAISARAMLTAGAWRLWLQGPVVTAVIIEDRTTARSFDTNTDGTSATPLHPIVEAWFYPQTSHVDAYPTIENVWASSTASNTAHDQSYSLAITQGNTSPASCYSEATFTHIAFSRWRRTCATGSAMGSIGIDHNAAYLTSTKALPNFDTSMTLTAAMYATITTPWSTVSQKIAGGGTGCGDSTGCVGMYEKSINGTGAHNYVGLLPKWDVLYLLSMKDPAHRDQMRAITYGNADEAGRMPIHFREADANAGSGDFFDAPCAGCAQNTLGSPGVGSVSAFGRVISLNARQQVSLVSSQNCFVGSWASDVIAYSTPRTTDNISGIQNDSSHAPDMYYLPYLLSGSYYYLEGLEMEAAYYAMQRNPCVDSSFGSQGRQGRWALAYPSSSVRAQAWAMRTIGYAAFITPDADAEHAYFGKAIKTQIQEFEGGHNLNIASHGTYGSDPDLAAVWTYGNTKDAGAGSYWSNNTGPSDNHGPSPIGMWRTLGTAFVQPPLHCPLSNDPSCDGVATVAFATSPWEESFMGASLGTLRDMGFGTDSLLQFVAKKYFRYALDSTYNAPYQLQMYRDPTFTTAAPTTWVSDGATLLSLYAAGMNQPCWQVVEAVTCDGLTGAMAMQDSHAYEARSVLSFLTQYTVDGYDGAAAWSTVDASIPDKRWLSDATNGNGSPVWSLIPRP